MVGDSCRCSYWLCFINMKMKPPESSLPAPKTSSVRGSSSSWRSHLSRMSPLINACPRRCRQPRPELGVSTAALVSCLPGVGADIVLYKYTRLQGSSTGSSVNSTQHLCWVVLSPRQVLKGIVCNLGFLKQVRYSGPYWDNKQYMLWYLIHPNPASYQNMKYLH